MKISVIAAFSIALALGAAACASSPSSAKHAPQVSEADADAVVRVLIDERGNPIEIVMVRASGNKQIDAQVFRAVKTWKFNPQSPAAWQLVPVSLKVGRH